MENEVKKTSKEWSKDCDYTILDPDGWDRNNFEFSWFKEMITLQEFMQRVMRSTCVMELNSENKNLLDNEQNNCSI